jgi:hypothetical protein
LRVRGFSTQNNIAVIAGSGRNEKVFDFIKTIGHGLAELRVVYGHLPGRGVRFNTDHGKRIV